MTEARETVARKVSERELQRTVTEALRLHSYLVFHDLDSRGNAPGLPDVIAVHPSTGSLLFIELKTEKGRVSKQQEAWAHALQGATSPEYHLWRPSDLDKALARIAQR